MFKTIREKLLASYLLIALVFALSGLYSIYHVADMANMTTELVVGQWVTEKLFDNAQAEVDRIVQEVLDPEAQTDLDQQVVAAQSTFDDLILLFEKTSFGFDLKSDLVPLMRRVQQELAGPLRMKMEPFQQRARYDEQLFKLLEDPAALGNLRLVRLLTQSEWVINDYLLEDVGTLRDKYMQLDRMIRATPGFAPIRKEYDSLAIQAERTLQLAEGYNHSRESFTASALKLKALLNKDAQTFDELIVRPKGRHVNEHFSLVLLVVSGAVTLSILLSVFMGVTFANSISRPLKKTVDVIEALERGNYDLRLASDRPDEVGRVAQAIDMFADNLQTAMHEIDREVAERKIAETDARDSERKYRQLTKEFKTLLEGIADSIILVSRDGLIVWANHSTCLQLGQPDLNLVGSRVGELERLYRFSTRVDCVAKTLASGKPHDGTFRTVDERVFGIKTFPLFDHAGELTGVIKMSSDITERYLLRQTAIETSRLAALGELSAGVAHEINNPNALTLLNVPVLIDVFREMLPLLEQKVENLEELDLAGMSWTEITSEVPYMLEEMLQGGRRIQRIVEDLKDFVRQGGGQDYEPVEINRAVEAAIRLLDNKINNSTSNFGMQLDADLPRVRGNLQQIEQVVINLVQNACLALESREAAVEVCTRYDPEREINLIVVSDKGKGIAPEHLAHLTEPFFTTRRNEGGTGLGLSISARIANEHGGSLKFISQPEEGTTAIFQLPVVREDV